MSTLVVDVSFPLEAALDLLILILLDAGNESFVEGSFVLASHFFLLLFLDFFTLHDSEFLLFRWLHLQYYYFLLFF